MPTTKRKARKIHKEAKAKIGKTKTIKGVGYKLNKNYRWERMGNSVKNEVRSSVNVVRSMGDELHSSIKRLKLTKRPNITKKPILPVT